MKLYLSFILIQISCFNSISCFNLESRLPILKIGTGGTYFGFSVAQHKSRDNEIFGNRFIVGAPLTNTEQEDTDNAGAVYQCPVSTENYDCQRVRFGRFDSEKPGEHKNFQYNASDGWLGVSVSSQATTGSVMACSHLYHKTKNVPQPGTQRVETQKHITGVCLALNDRLQYENKKYWPCDRRVAHNSGKSIHELLGQCLAGVSSSIGEADDIVIGAPGAYNWQGALFSKEMKQRGAMKYSERTTSPSTPVTQDSYLGMSTVIGKFLRDNKIQYIAGAPRSNLTGEVVIFDNPVSGSKMSYRGKIRGGTPGSQFGYSVAKADVNGDGFDDLFVGAPFMFEASKNRFGAVYGYMNKPGTGLRYSVDEDKLNNFEPRPDIEIYGVIPPDARFGFSIANAGDLNQDNYEDIAIGAPYENGGGTVYIYLGSQNGLINKPSQRIKAAELPLRPTLRSFGYSLSGGVDMDQNGYPDLLVGAYESDRVVLLRSRPVIRIVTEVRNLPNEGINPQGEVCAPKNLVCFRFEACLRFDDNSRHIKDYVTVRYRIEGDTIKTVESTKRIEFSEPFNNTNFVVERNLRLSPRDRKFECGVETVYLKEFSDGQDTLNQLRFLLTYKLVERDPPVYSNRGSLPPLENWPILDQLAAKQTFYVNFTKNCGSDNECISNLVIDAEFSNLPIVNGEQALILGGQETINVTVILTNDMEPAFLTELFIYHQSVLPFSKYYASVEHTCVASGSKDSSTSQENRIKCEIANPFGSNDNNVNLEQPQREPTARAELTFEFETAHIQALDQQIQIRVESSTLLKSFNEESKSVNVSANVVVRANASLNARDPKGQVLYEGDSLGQNDVKYLQEVGSIVTHEYTVLNSGPGLLPSCELVISWPVEVWPYGMDEGISEYKRGKWLLYLTEQPQVDSQNVVCDVPEEWINPLNLRNISEYPSTASALTETFEYDTSELGYGFNEEPSYAYSDQAVGGRVKRDVRANRIPAKMIVPSYKDAADERGVTLDCEPNSEGVRTARCIYFTCKFPAMEVGEGFAVKVKSRIWKHTFLQDYRDVDYVRILSHGKVKIDTIYQTEQNSEKLEAFAETRAVPSGDITVVGESEIPVYVIPLAVMIGLFLLVLLILALWKCGFFKRKSRDEDEMQARKPTLMVSEDEMEMDISDFKEMHDTDAIDECYPEGYPLKRRI